MHLALVLLGVLTVGHLAYSVIPVFQRYCHSLDGMAAFHKLPRVAPVAFFLLHCNYNLGTAVLKNGQWDSAMLPMQHRYAMGRLAASLGD